MSFDDVLARPTGPKWRTRPVKATPLDDFAAIDLDAAIQKLDETAELAYPSLRVIDGEAR